MSRKPARVPPEPPSHTGVRRGGLFVPALAILGVALGLGGAWLAFREPPAVPRASAAGGLSPKDSAVLAFPTDLAEAPEIARARSALAEGRAKDAIEHFSSLRRRMPNRPEPLRALAQVYLESGDPASALDAAERAVGVDPKDAVSQTILGQILEARGLRDDAEQAYLRAVELDPSQAWAQFLLGRIAEDRHQDAVATTRYRAALAADPTLAPAAHYLGSQLRGAGLHDEAIRVLAAAVALDPRNATLRCNLAHTYLERGDAEDAAREFRLALPSALEKAETAYFLGRALELLARGDEAREAYRLALREDPILSMAWYAVAQLEKHAGRTAESEAALREFERARAAQNRLQELREKVKKVPGDAGALIEYAESLLSAGRTRQGTEALRRAIAMDPSNARARALLEASAAGRGARE